MKIPPSITHMEDQKLEHNSLVKWLEARYPEISDKSVLNKNKWCLLGQSERSLRREVAGGYLSLQDNVLHAIAKYVNKNICGIWN